MTGAVLPAPAQIIYSHGSTSIHYLLCSTFYTIITSFCKTDPLASAPSFHSEHLIFFLEGFNTFRSPSKGQIQPARLYKSWSAPASLPLAHFPPATRGPCCSFKTPDIFLPQGLCTADLVAWPVLFLGTHRASSHLLNTCSSVTLSGASSMTILFRIVPFTLYPSFLLHFSPCHFSPSHRLYALFVVCVAAPDCKLQRGRQFCMICLLHLEHKIN